MRGGVEDANAILPEATASDNGKVLGVDGGEYKLVEQNKGAEEEIFSSNNDFYASKIGDIVFLKFNNLLNTDTNILAVQPIHTVSEPFAYERQCYLLNPSNAPTFPRPKSTVIFFGKMDKGVSSSIDVAVVWYSTGASYIVPLTDSFPTDNGWRINASGMAIGK